MDGSPAPSPGGAHAKKSLRRRLAWWFVAGLAILAAFIPALFFVLQPPPNRNALAIGDLARVESQEITLQELAELDFMTRDDLLALRRQAVARYPQLIAGEYHPAEEVFGRIVDGLPWWGIVGAFHHGRGRQSIEGVSEQSLSLFNPFLLAVPELYLNWDESEAAAAAAFGQDAPAFCAPRSLTWYPGAAQVEAAYDADCLRRNNVQFFSLIAYNARDLNLNYIYVDYNASRNISKADAPRDPYHNPQFLHRGDSCGYPGGCNNVSPRTPEIDSLQVTGWPAEVVVWFWRDDPGTAAVPPDLEFRLLFD